MGKKARTRARTPKRNPSRKRRIRTRTRTHLKGGMVQRYPKKPSWEAVRAMIQKGVRLELLSATSVSGFIFRLDIPPDPESNEFFGLNNERTAFTQPVYSIVLKFVFLSEKHSKITIQVQNDKGGITDIIKSTERASNFLLEAMQQQRIYQETLLPQGRPVTLAVVDVSKFDAPNTQTLIDELEKVPSFSGMVRDMLGYLKTNVDENVHLGLISMELANPSFQTLQVGRRVLDAPLYDDACAYALAQVALLFVKLKVVLFDCHEANVLVNTAIETNPYEDKAILIDFGRMFRGGEFFKVFSKDKQGSIKEAFFKMSGNQLPQTMFDIQRINEHNMNEANLLNVLHYLAFLDCAIAVPRTVKRHPAEDAVKIKRPQMIALLRYLHPELTEKDDWLNTPRLSQPVEPAKVQKILSMFREMVGSSQAKEESLLGARGQLYRVPEIIPDQLLVPLLPSPLRTETPQVETPPTVNVTTPLSEKTQAYSREEPSQNKRPKIGPDFEAEANIL